MLEKGYTNQMGVCTPKISLDWVFNWGGDDYGACPNSGREIPHFRPEMLGSDFGRTDFLRIFVVERRFWTQNSAFQAQNVRVGFWQKGFFADFCWWAAGFWRGFCRRIFSSHYCGRKVPRKILPRKSPAKSSQIYTTKSLTHFCRGAGPQKCAPPAF